MKCCRRLLLLLLFAHGLCSIGHAQAVTVKDNVEGSRQIRAQEFPSEISRLQALVEDCKTNKTADACNPSLVGADLVVTGASEKRAVSLEWIRSAFKSAAAATKSKNKPDWENASSTLDSVQERLKKLSDQQTSPHPNRDLTSIRRTLDYILAGHEYAQEKPPSLFQKAWNKILDWLFRGLLGAGRSQASHLLGYILAYSLLLLSAALLVWWFLNKAVSQRLMPIPRPMARSASPSARDWRDWLAQGREFAALERWRDAIHFIYWSAISSLEVQGLWPADRARTPREYLRLVSTHPATQAHLANLTRSFEQTWYGNRAANKEDFEEACLLLERLVAP